MSKNEKTPNSPKTIGFRAPPDLADWLSQQAKANERTVSNQTVWALQQYRRQLEAAEGDRP